MHSVALMRQQAQKKQISANTKQLIIICMVLCREYIWYYVNPVPMKQLMQFKVMMIICSLPHYTSVHSSIFLCVFPILLVMLPVCAHSFRTFYFQTLENTKNLRNVSKLLFFFIKSDGYWACTKYVEQQSN